MPHSLNHHLQALSRDEIVRITGDASVEITAPFVEDNRQIQTGGVFVARSGQSVDGHQFIDDAIARGAVAIIGEKPLELDAPYVQVKDAKLITGQLAASYYEFPSRKMTVIGITGTNGKTTTTHILHSILKIATKGTAGFISTIGADFGGSSTDTGLHVTTPHASDVQKYLAQMVESGITHAILEMTSHGLAQGRLSGVDIDMAIITNLTHEHLDYHGSFEAYRAAKGIMFEILMPSHRKVGVPKVSILNADDDSYGHYKIIPADKVISYGLNTADLTAVDIDYAPDSTYFTVGDERYSHKFVGQFNIYNALAALAASQALDIAPEDIRTGLQNIDTVSGRMQRIDEGQNFTAIVDFAHTPDALEKAIAAARTMLPDGNKLITIFGSAGLRDVEKRRLMAEVSAEYSDITVLTAEDPRTESLDAILEHMAQGCIAKGGTEGETFFRVPDRGLAIFEACQMANTGDIVMACGKGHEQSMCFGKIEYPWDDRDAMRAALRGEPLKTLPTAEA